MLDYNPLKYKLDSRLARLLGIHTESRPLIINALWQYIKQHKLQDPNEREFVNCDKFLAQVRCLMGHSQVATVDYMSPSTIPYHKLTVI